MPSAIFKLFVEACEAKKQITCQYHGYYRELCPHVVGYNDGKERSLSFQFGGDSEKGLAPGGSWRCMDLNEVTEAKIQDGPWHSQLTKGNPQYCVKNIVAEVVL